MSWLHAIVLCCSLLVVALGASALSTAQEAIPLLTQTITLAKQNDREGHDAQLEALTQRVAASEKASGPSTPRPTDASLVWTKDRAPQFEDFPVRTVYRGRPARVDFRSDPTARQFRTRLTQGAKEGPNFAGHYTVVEWGCGTNCGVSTIVDAITGKVYDGEGAERGTAFRLDSYLFIADPPHSPEGNAYPDNRTDTLPVRYYVWAHNKLQLIYTENCMVINNKQKCGGK